MIETLLRCCRRALQLGALAFPIAGAHADSATLGDDGPVRRASPPALTRANAALTPSSHLNFETARGLASVASVLSGRDVVVAAVLPTGSMRPFFDENALLLLEAVPFDQLRLGDVVTFYHPKLKVVVAHRLVEKRGDAFWSKGDYNGHMDDLYITAENYRRRLMGVLYMDPRAARPGTDAIAAISK